MKRQNLFKLLALTTFLFTGVCSYGAAIIWNTPTTISGDSDVSTVGTFNRAYSFGDVGLGSFTINGVTFSPFEITGAITTVGATTLSSSAVSGNNNAFGFGSGDFVALSSDYQAILQSAAFGNAGSPFTLTINSLTPGTTYVIQIWVNDSRGATSDRNDVLTATNAETLDVNVQNTDGGLGQFAIGTFVADSGSQAVTIDGGTVGVVSPSPQVNAFAVFTIPEPSSAALFITAVAAISSRRRKRQGF